MANPPPPEPHTHTEACLRQHWYLGDLLVCGKTEAVKPLPPMPEMFRLGYEAGRYDGQDHDCRMFEPTAQRAWEDRCAK